MIIGIDPGFTGAIAFLKDDKDFDLGYDLCIWDMPVRTIGNKKQVNAKELVRRLKNCNTPKLTRYVVIEDVHSMPEQGVASTFRFGYNAGILLGIFEALEIKILKVRPCVWKPAMNLDRDKKKSLALAKKIFPAYKSYFLRAKDDGRAEAALLAYHARRALG